MLFEMSAAKDGQSGRLPWDDQTHGNVLFPMHIILTKKVLPG